MELLRTRNTVSEEKDSIEGIKSKKTQERKGPMNMKIDQYKVNKIRLKDKNLKMNKPFDICGAI
jgi:hypothetical protein